ncbi:hypothetical protein BDV96DRAFT_645906 [Lophiotrema nucula]|uniref:Uncharacterized protein n=1 Tax=Lophiotrema nucula TaxID=690887 RepID=A0A6A5Z879_9PLEO|nr:hypothetical protein BDV96DRAFT_645906 [Lophiotrema nucula]
MADPLPETPKQPVSDNDSQPPHSPLPEAPQNGTEALPHSLFNVLDSRFCCTCDCDIAPEDDLIAFQSEKEELTLCMHCWQRSVTLWAVDALPSWLPSHFYDFVHSGLAIYREYAQFRMHRGHTFDCHVCKKRKTEKLVGFKNNLWDEYYCSNCFETEITSEKQGEKSVEPL